MTELPFHNTWQGCSNALHASPPSDALLGSRLICRLPGSEPRDGSRFSRLLRSALSLRCADMATVCGWWHGGSSRVHGKAGQAAAPAARQWLAASDVPVLGPGAKQTAYPTS